MRLKTEPKALGVALLAIGLVGALIGLLAVENPAGLKAADDNDPFGEPPSRLSITAVTAAFAVLGAAGVWLVLPRR